MKDGLAALLTRKTDHSRLNALDAVEGWRKALDAVAGAERWADCKIELPAALSQGVTQAANKAIEADYVTALELSRQYQAKQQQVLKNWQELLQAVIENRLQSCKQVQTNLSNAELQQNSELNRDNVVLMNEKKAMLDGANSKIGTEPSLDESRKLGASAGIVIAFVIYCLSMAVFGDKVPFNVFCLLAILSVFSGVLLVPMIFRYLYESNKSNIKADLQRQTHAAATRHRQAQEKIKSKHSEGIKQLTDALQLAEAYKARAEQALQGLKAQA